MNDSGQLVLHIDVDAFFASVEQLLIPRLRGRPVIVGSGCIASCSYEARRRGLQAGMSLSRAQRQCPGAIVLAGDYQIYRCFAEHVWRVCRRYTCGLETYLDEAYGDAAGMERVHGDPPTLGRKLQGDVLSEVGLPVSIGLAANRMMAKIASASAKPGGVVWIAPGAEDEFLTAMAVEKLLGVGPKTAGKLRDMNIRTVGELRRLSRELLRAMLGLRGEVLYERCRGRDTGSTAVSAVGRRITGETPLCHGQAKLGRAPIGTAKHMTFDRGTRPPIPKTISRETTFHQPTCRREEIRGMLQYLLERAMRAVRSRRLLTRCVELSIRYDDWREQAARRTLSQATAADDEVLERLWVLLEQLHKRRVALRHVGIVLSSFSPAGEEGLLFEPDSRRRRRELYIAIDNIRDRWGHGSIVTGESAELLGQLERNDYGFILRTPSLTK